MRIWAACKNSTMLLAYSFNSHGYWLDTVTRGQSKLKRKSISMSSVVSMADKGKDRNHMFTILQMFATKYKLNWGVLFSPLMSTLLNLTDSNGVVTLTNATRIWHVSIQYAGSLSRKKTNTPPQCASCKTMAMESPYCNCCCTIPHLLHPMHKGTIAAGTQYLESAAVFDICKQKPCTFPSPGLYFLYLWIPAVSMQWSLTLDKKILKQPKRCQTWLQC